MILKDYEEEYTNDKLKGQGNKAEQQMAFYLKRFFSDNKDVFIFNNIYVKHNDEIAQIDHLILYKYGIFVIESKSCLGEFSYNKNDEWTRKTGTYFSGFASPYEQANRQIDVLLKHFDTKKEEIFGKAIGKLCFRFGGRDKKAFVAISDNAIITRPGERTKYDNYILKADKICDAIKKEMKKHSFLISLNPFSSVEDAIPPFSKETLNNLINEIILVDQETRKFKNKNKNKEKPVKIINNLELPIKNYCEYCEKENCKEIIYGCYGYYFHCIHCNKNNNIKVICPDCNKKAKLRKSKDNYYIKCLCGCDFLYYKNN